MPPYKKPSAVQRKTAQEQAISLVLTGARNLLVPLFNAEHVYVNHPVALQMTDLAQYGLLPRIAEELDTLAETNVDAAKWQIISATFRSKYALELAPVDDTSAVSQ